MPAGIQEAFSAGNQISLLRRIAADDGEGIGPHVDAAGPSGGSAYSSKTPTTHLVNRDAERSLHELSGSVGDANDKAIRSPARSSRWRSASDNSCRRVERKASASPRSP